MKSIGFAGIILLTILHTSSCHSDINDSKKNNVNKVPLYRLYKPSTDNHFYTTSADEANNAASNLGYTREGTTGLVSTTSGKCNLKAVHRLYKSSGAKEDHFYTISDSEASTAESVHGYKREGVAFYCAEKANECGASSAVYRYNRGSDHFYTTNVAEGHKVVADGNTLEGIMCYIWQ